MVGKLAINSDDDIKRDKNMVKIDNLGLKLSDIDEPLKLNNNHNDTVVVHDNIHIKMEENNPLVSDDLKQFLSGDIAEAEDNA